MFPISHKTVIVLDNTARFRSLSSGQPIDFDVGIKMKNTVSAGIIPLAPVCKSLWTSSIEGIQEYARIVYDLFYHTDRLLSIVAIDDRTSSIVQDWSPQLQNMVHLNSCLARISLTGQSYGNQYLSSHPDIPKCEDDCLKKGLLMAIDSLSNPSSIQRQMKKKEAKSSNKGRIILISSFQDKTGMRSLAEFLVESINKLNVGLREANGSLLPVNECHLSIVNTHSIDDPLITHFPEYFSLFASPLVSSEVHTVKGGSYLAIKFISLVQSHYGLASTTVTGIPMKEEQNASSSANYDVEIMHLSEAHTNLMRFTNREGVPTNFSKIYKEAENYETLPLKWCTPRSSSIELHQCDTAFRISPVDVNSRPSSCLTNFLLSGRTVMLELTKLKGSKIMSHMLSSHHGELYIHTLQTDRSQLEDPPSITEGVGGRLSDYRINDFCELMKKNKLGLCSRTARVGGVRVPTIGMSLGVLRRQTSYWPIVSSHTLIFNPQLHIQSLINLIPKEELTPEDVNECKNAIYQIVKLESKGSSLNLSSISGRGKGPKKEELYKLLWKELDHFIRVHATTPEHEEILKCLRDLHSSQNSSQSSNAPQSGKKETPLVENQESSSGNQITTPVSNCGIGIKLEEETSLAWKELDAYNTLSEREKREINDNTSAKRARIQDIQSPPPESAETDKDVEMKRVRDDPVMKIDRSLFEIWTDKLKQNFNRRPDFDGRSYKIAPLYSHLNQVIE